MKNNIPELTPGQKLSEKLSVPAAIALLLTIISVLAYFGV